MSSSGDCGRRSTASLRSTRSSRRGSGWGTSWRPSRSNLRAVEFELTAEQREIQGLAREFAREEIEPHAGQWDRDRGFPRALLDRLGEVGLLGVCVPEEHGGAGADFLSYV